MLLGGTAATTSTTASDASDRSVRSGRTMSPSRVVHLGQATTRTRTPSYAATRLRLTEGRRCVRPARRVGCPKVRLRCAPGIVPRGLGPAHLQVLAALARPLVNALSTEFVDRVLTSRTQKPSPLPERASDLVLWWRGRDLNPRPSGYEPSGPVGDRGVRIGVCSGHRAFLRQRAVLTRALVGGDTRWKC
jgi:hypothetical protein